MQKPKNKERGIVYSTVVLLLISGLVAGIVAVVNVFTAPVIEQNTAENIRQNIDTLFDGNSGFDDITAECDTASLDGIGAVYRVKSGTGGEDSYCMLSTAAGYGGEIELLVGFSCDGVITGVKVLDASGETPGIGQLITEDEFLARFGGLYCNDEGTKIDGVSGATVSSTAAVKAVNSACVMMTRLLGEGEVSAQ